MYHLAVSLFFTLIFICTTFTHAAIAEQNTFKKYINSSIITIAYHKNFPYKKSYDKNLIPGCKKIDTNRPILSCTEYIQLMRPMTLIKKWQDTQKKTGYLPTTLPEFNIFNVAGEIVSISSPVAYSKHLLSETNSTGHMVTGKFIRHSDKVRHYMFATGKDRVIDNINVTENHLFYVRNRNKFIPAGKIHPTDSLINEEGKTIYLKHSISGKDKDEKLADKIPEVVYNLEISSNHTYFIGRQKILVHNQCFLEEYFAHLEKKGVIHEENHCMYLKYSKDNISPLLLPIRDKNYIIQPASTDFELPTLVSGRFARLALVRKTPSHFDEQIWVPLERMSLDRYKKNLPCIAEAAKRRSSINAIWKLAKTRPDFCPPDLEKTAAQEMDEFLNMPSSVMLSSSGVEAGRIPQTAPHLTSDSAGDLSKMAQKLLMEDFDKKDHFSGSTQ